MGSENCEVATPSLQSETLSYPTPKSVPSSDIENDGLDPGFYVSPTKPESFHASVGPVVTLNKRNSHSPISDAVGRNTIFLNGGISALVVTE